MIELLVECTNIYFRCSRRGLPFSNKLYAVKILFNDNALRTRDIRDAFENEWEILSRIR